MKNLFTMTRTLIAGLMFGATLAHAGLGTTVTRTQESLVRLGMTEVEVRQALGCPARVITYGNAPGPSWNYYVAGTHFTTEFGIDFGPDGKVVKFREYWKPTGGG
jgi:outer membrane protein assembly factor BamE (lipoprotein component of BamABCDE complex)